MNKYVKQCIGEIIVSCQAPIETPLYGADYMKAMAASVLLGGAKAIRACWPQDIKAIRELGDFPIVGINKVLDPNIPRYEQIFITPSLKTAEEIIEAGSNIIAMDCTIKAIRGEEELYQLLKSVKTAYPGIAIMADCSTLEEMVFAANTGFVDIVSSTLSGSRKQMVGPDLDIIIKAKKQISLPINAEGRIYDLQDLEAVLDTKAADMVTIGRAITMPQAITHRFVNFYEEYKNKQS